MASTITRRPLPALVALLALLALTAIVWWRVLDRHTGASRAATPRPTPTCTPSPAATSAPPSTLPDPSTVTVSVLNSTQRAGLAGTVRTTLIADGFRSPAKAADDSPTIAGVAQIRYGPSGAAAARLLSYYLPGAQLVQGATNSAAVVVSLGLKYTAVAAPSAVRAAMARDGVTSATPGASTTTSAGRSGAAATSPAGC